MSGVFCATLHQHNYIIDTAFVEVYFVERIVVMDANQEDNRGIIAREAVASLSKKKSKTAEAGRYCRKKEKKKRYVYVVV